MSRLVALTNVRHKCAPVPRNFLHNRQDRRVSASPFHPQVQRRPIHLRWHICSFRSGTRCLEIIRRWRSGWRWGPVGSTACAPLAAGLIPAAKLGISLYVACYENHVLSNDEFNAQYGAPIAQHCIAEAPDISHFVIGLEPVRLCLIYVAGASQNSRPYFASPTLRCTIAANCPFGCAAILLRSKRAYGGINEIMALESARMDAADGRTNKRT